MEVEHDKLSPSDASTLRILVATDNHLGYNEKDPIRGNDSFDAFEEILRYARDLDVDMMVLGGDLFHDNKPSRKCLHRTMQLLRHYCFGDRESQVELLSDPSQVFHSPFGTANYLDPNLNVAIPVFAIHGNHDDPAGDGNLSAMDILSTAGLLNYFGRAREVDDITIAPVILRKGDTHLALYGLGNIRDERLYRTFIARKVKTLRPQDQLCNPDRWFNLMLFHQNRAAHSPTNHIPETFLDDFLDLIVWGHEHDCQIDPLYIPQRDFYIVQPGSSTVTSLSEGEAVKKHIALLTVCGSKFELQPLPLKSSRPFVFADLVLGAVLPGNADSKAVYSCISQRLEEMVQQAGREHREENPDQPMPLPLIRLRVDYSGAFTTLNPHRFGQTFQERVANPRDMIHLVRKRAARTPSNREDRNAAVEQPEEGNQSGRVEDLVNDYLGVQKLDLFPRNEFSDCVRIFVEKDDKDAIEAFMKASLERINGRLRGRDLESLRVEIERERMAREEEWGRLNPTGREALLNHRVAVPSGNYDDSDFEMGEPENTQQPSVRGRGTRGRGASRARGTAARGGRATTRPAPLTFTTPVASPKRASRSVASQSSKSLRLDEDASFIDDQHEDGGDAYRHTPDTQSQADSVVVVKETPKSRWPNRNKK